MTRTIKFKNRKAAKELGGKLAVRVEFMPPDEAFYFDLRDIAVSDFETTQTTLARRILIDFVKMYSAMGAKRKKEVIEKLKLPLDGALELV